MNHIRPDWPVPENVHAFFTLRTGGVSHGPYESLNLATHVGDDACHVAENRRLLGLHTPPCWLEQVHSNTCILVDGAAGKPPRADAAVTARPDQVLVVMVADCLPILMCAPEGDRIAAVHAGWRGLANGVIDAAIDQMGAGPIVAWLGPGIGPCHYQVDETVRQAFSSAAGFEPDGGNHYRLDLYASARAQLESRNVEVFGGGYCTSCDETRFFSHRRDGNTGRMGAFIWKS